MHRSTLTRRDCTLLTLAGAAGLLPRPAAAALDIGDTAPPFTAQAVQAGQIFEFSSAATLAKGPMVLYFFPAAFSEGCSIEAKEFADAMPQIEALGASVLGVSGDDINTLSKFSVQTCNGKFPVASDSSLAIIKAYDASMRTRPDYANRVSYVLTPDAKVALSYVSLNPVRHVQRSIEALKGWRAAGGK